MSNSIDLKALFRDPEAVSLFRERSPAHNDLGANIQLSEDDLVLMDIPFQKRFSDLQQSPALHPGVVMTAMDSAMGLATIINLEEFSSLATLELRYDQLRPTASGSAVRVTTLFESVDDDIAYLTAQAEDVNGPFARGTGRFILTPANSGFVESALSMLDESGEFS